MNKLFLPGTFFIGTLVLLFVYMQGAPSRQTATAPGSGKVPYMQVHQYKRETAIKMGIEKEQAQLRKHSEKPQLHPSERSHNDFYEGDLVPEKNVSGEDISDKSYRQAVTLDQKMDGFLAKKQKFSELETMKKKAYVDEFKREARAMGFEVVIDNNMKIISVKKIKKK